MSEFLDQVQADCLEAETDLGSRLMVWTSQTPGTTGSGLTYPVAPTLIRRGAVLVVGGKEVEIKLTLRVRFAGTRASGQAWEFDTLPKQGDRVTYPSTSGTDYRIAQVNNAHGAFLEIDLTDVNR